MALIQDVSTRWNSTDDMLNRINKLSTPLVASITDPKAPKSLKEQATNMLSPDEMLFVKDMTNVLDVFKTATVLLSAEKKPTAHLVIPTYQKIHRVLKSNTKDKPYLSKMKKQMRSNLDKRDQDNMIYKKASFLHPTTKSLQFLPQADVEGIHEAMKEEMKNLPSNSAKTTESSAADEKVIDCKYNTEHTVVQFAISFCLHSCCIN